MAADHEATFAEYELVIPVRLPEDMTPESFLWNTRIEWHPHPTSRPVVPLRMGSNLDTVPEFTGPKELRRV